ncbi:hypothetical protein OS242_01525 [Tumebacillus sp. DT12]|uniref:Iron-sulfur cluster biosynthesis family protein n=1 Tax=Tumebacillus lacus TaxID=2995335 RepID=A0ABT3WVF0_9BACL|nr:hypothetical protein [Tumebacillus lacus]MCX7568649.1 hypothetical protein [Tumebacillus lacus]
MTLTEITVEQAVAELNKLNGKDLSVALKGKEVSCTFHLKNVEVHIEEQDHELDAVLIASDNEDDGVAIVLHDAQRIEYSLEAARYQLVVTYKGGNQIQYWISTEL